MEPTIHCFLSLRSNFVASTLTVSKIAGQERKASQYFEVMGSRGIYKDGWFASVLGPRVLGFFNKND